MAHGRRPSCIHTHSPRSSKRATVHAPPLLHPCCCSRLALRAGPGTPSHAGKQPARLAAHARTVAGRRRASSPSAAHTTLTHLCAAACGRVHRPGSAAPAVCVPPLWPLPPRQAPRAARERKERGCCLCVGGCGLGAPGGGKASWARLLRRESCRVVEAAAGRHTRALVACRWMRVCDEWRTEVCMLGLAMPLRALRSRAQGPPPLASACKHLALVQGRGGEGRAAVRNMDLCEHHTVGTTCESRT